MAFLAIDSKVNMWVDITNTNSPPRPHENTVVNTPCDFPLHRFNATTSSLLPLDVRVKEEKLCVFDISQGGDSFPLGVSCFVPITPMHAYNTKRASEQRSPCCYLPCLTHLPRGLGLFFTGELRYEFYPSNNELRASDIGTVWHFLIFPTQDLEEEFRIIKRGRPEALSKMIRNMNWNSCDLRAEGRGSSPSLFFRDSDMVGVQDYLVLRLYQICEVWHEQATEEEERFFANVVHTFIAVDKPTIETILLGKYISWRIFVALQSVTLEGDEETLDEGRHQILRVIRERHLWKETWFNGARDSMNVYFSSHTKNSCKRVGREDSGSRWSGEDIVMGWRSQPLLQISGT